MPHGVRIRDLRMGTGATVGRGCSVVIHCRTYLNRGDLVRDSRDSGGPVTFRVGRRDVIAGLEYGVVGMRAGGVREVRVPPHLGYGPREACGVPANALLRLEVELLEVRDEGAN
jgi:FKBP-type peptidyl-prolyl cis-trans isomerase